MYTQTSEDGDGKGGKMGADADMGCLAKCYSVLAMERRPYLERARDASAASLPRLFPPAGVNGSMQLPQKYSSVGAEAVGALANKLLLALFPPSVPFFRLQPSAKAIKVIENALKQAGQTEQRDKIVSEIDGALAHAETIISMYIESTLKRAILFQLFQHLIVSGNGLLWQDRDGKMRFFSLISYVVRRSGDEVRQIIVKTYCSIDSLPMSVRQAALMQAGRDLDLDGKIMSPLSQMLPADGDSEVVVFVEQRRDGNNVKVRRELLDGTLVDGFGTPADGAPGMPQRFSAIDGEHYGRGMIDDFLGDFLSAEGLARAIVEASAIMARMVALVKPGATVSVTELNESPNGGFVVGREDDVAFIQTQKSQDLRGVSEAGSAIERRIQSAFLSAQSARRQGERVTAEEIQMMAKELETSLGGVYSTLSQELQLPLLNRAMNTLRARGELNDTKTVSTPVIIAGLDALGRSAEAARLSQAIGMLSAAITPQELAKWFKVGKLIDRVTSSTGVSSMNDVFKSQEEFDKDQAAASQAATMQQSALKLAQGAAPAVGAAAAQHIAPPAAQGLAGGGPPQAPQGPQ